MSRNGSNMALEKTPRKVLKNVVVIEDNALFVNGRALNPAAVNFLRGALNSSSSLLVIGTFDSVARRRCLYALGLVGISGFDYVSVGDKDLFGTAALAVTLRTHAPYYVVARDKDVLKVASEVLERHEGTLLLMHMCPNNNVSVYTQES